MANNFNFILQSELVLQKCKIFVTSTYFLGHWNTMQKTLRKFNALRHIVFDNVDNVEYKTFQEIMKPISDEPKQVFTAQSHIWHIFVFIFPNFFQLIVVSNVYKSVLNEIYVKGKNDLAIFSGPLDIAVMAKSKLDVIIAKRSEISRPTGQKYKFDHVLGMLASGAINFAIFSFTHNFHCSAERIRMSSDKTFMIICDRNQYVNAIKKELERLDIKITILPAKETGERYGNEFSFSVVRFQWKLKSFFPAHRLPPIHLPGQRDPFLSLSRTEVDRYIVNRSLLRVQVHNESTNVTGIRAYARSIRIDD